MRNNVTSALRRAERSYLESVYRDIRLTNSATSTNLFWRHIKRLTGKIKGSVVPDLVPPSHYHSPAPATSDAEKAELLNQCFAFQCHSNDHQETIHNISTSASSKSFTTLRTTPSDVYRVLSKLKPGKAPGLDGIPPLLLSSCAKGIANSLCILFNRSFSDGTVPDDWKEALVIPVFKRVLKPNYLKSNYRPIAYQL